MNYLDVTLLFRTKLRNLVLMIKNEQELQLLQLSLEHNETESIKYLGNLSRFNKRFEWHLFLHEMISSQTGVNMLAKYLTVVKTVRRLR